MYLCYDLRNCNSAFNVVIVNSLLLVPPFLIPYLFCTCLNVDAYQPNPITSALRGIPSKGIFTQTSQFKRLIKL